MTNPERESNEVEAQEAELLPPREAMSIIPTTGDPGGLDGLAAASSPTADGTGIPPADGGAGTTAADAGELAATDAAASESSSESVTESDRHETIQATDTATAAS